MKLNLQAARSKNGKPLHCILYFASYEQIMELVATD